MWGDVVRKSEGKPAGGSPGPAPPGAPAVASTTVAPPEIRYLFGVQAEALEVQLLGTTTPKVGCSLSIETSLEFKDPAPVQPGAAGKLIELNATFVSLVSKGKMYDLCPGTTANSILKTERK